MAAARVLDVEVDVVRVGLPVQDEARRRLRRELEAALGELASRSSRASCRLGRGIRRADHAGVLGEHALATGEAVAGILLIDAGEDRGERVGVACPSRTSAYASRRWPVR